MNTSRNLIPWNPTAELLDETHLAQSLFQCLKEEDLDSFKEILSGHLDAKIKTRLARENGFAVRTLFDSLSAKGNPRLNTIAKLIKLACAS